MAQAQGNVVRVKYLAEVTPGTTPAAALTLLRYNTSSLNATLNTTVSSEVSTNGDDADVVRTSASSGGELGMEYSFAEYRPFVESAMRSTFSTAVSYSAITISAAAADNSLNDTGAGFSTANILPGHWIVASGFTGGNAGNNNKPMRVVSVTTTKIVVSGVTLVDDAAGESVTIKGRSVRNGTTKKTFTLEEEYTDLTTTFANYKGQQVNTMTLNAASGSLITGSFGFMGMTAAYATTTVGTGADIAATTNPVMSATANVGTVYIDGTAVSGIYFKNINLSTTVNARNLDAIGNLYPIAVNTGTFEATFAVTAYFSDTTLLTKFVNGTEFSLAYYFTDSSNNLVVIDAPRCKFTAGTKDGVAKNSDVMQNLTIRAMRSTTLPYALQISELG